jgi:hypothetical protein
MGRSDNTHAAITVEDENNLYERPMAAKATVTFGGSPNPSPPATRANHFPVTTRLNVAVAATNVLTIASPSFAGLAPMKM